MRALFWLSVAAILYPYVGYPLVLALVAAIRRERQRAAILQPPPAVTMIVPVHNEAARIRSKLANTAALSYPRGLLQVIFVCDGCTDETAAVIRETGGNSTLLVELSRRSGKAAALNAGLVVARNELLVFSDASIELERDALQAIVRPFADPAVGCVSGEDRVVDAGGEGLYGRYELLLRRLESTAGSIVGASGSFYAQRRSLCTPFTPGMAPDFLSVLRTVERGFLAVSEPSAIGRMTSVKDPRQEFGRKVRTLLRGMTTLLNHKRLLNPMAFPFFSFALISHKLIRWVAPAFLALALVSCLWLASLPPYLVALAAQLLLYLLALGAFARFGGLHRAAAGRLALYFTAVNLAVVVAWLQYARGVRQEVWTPSQR